MADDKEKPTDQTTVDNKTDNNQPPDNKQGQDDLKATIERYQTEIDKLKSENAERRIAQKQFIESISTALGIEDKKGKDGDALVTELKTLKDELQRERLLNRFNTVAKKLEADKKANLILAVIKDKGQLSDLTDETQIEDAIRAVIKDYPELKNNTVTKVGDDTGQTGEPSVRKSVNDMIRQAAGR
jgi:hypothetical protein